MPRCGVAGPTGKLLFFYLGHLKYLFMVVLLVCMFVYVRVCMHDIPVEVRRKVLEVGSLLPPYGLQESNSGCQAFLAISLTPNFGFWSILLG